MLFVPVEKGNRGAAASGSTNADGRFELMSANRPGATVGDYCVTIAKHNSTIVTNKATSEHSLSVEWLTPPKYSDAQTSGLRRTVSAQEHDFLFELESQ